MCSNVLLCNPETSWSGSVDDIKARLELLCDVLDRQLESGKSQLALWYTGKILASLVTYYHSDAMMLHNYLNFLGQYLTQYLPVFSIKQNSVYMCYVPEKKVA